MNYITLRRQAGLTLIELIVGLGIIAAVVVGALSLSTAADSSQKSTQMLSEITALRQAAREIWKGQGSYGNTGTNLNGVLYSAKRVPSTMKVDTTTTPVTLTHSLNGTVSLVSQGTSFTMTLTNIPTDVCVSLLTSGGNGNMWSGISVQGSTVTLPATPATAATACAADPSTIVFSAS